MNSYGPTDPCRRTGCAPDPHLAGRHLDPRDELYDGPDWTIRALPSTIQDPAVKILRGAPQLMPELMDLIHHMGLLSDQIAHISVDRDHKVREALARSADCRTHGQDITALNAALTAADEAHRRCDAGRRALIDFLTTTDDTTRLRALAVHEKAWRR